VLPAELPQIVTGIRVGFTINDARSVLRTDIILVGMLTIGMTSYLIDLIENLNKHYPGNAAHSDTQVLDDVRFTVGNSEP